MDLTTWMLAMAAISSKRNSLDSLKGNDYRHLQLRAKRKSREISASDLNDLSTLRRRQQIKTAILRCKRRDEKFRCEITELKENLGIIKDKIDAMIKFTTDKKRQSYLRRRWINFNRHFWKQVPLIEDFFLQASFIIFASLMVIHFIRAVVSLVLPQIFMECHPLVYLSAKNYSLCSS